MRPVLFGDHDSDNTCSFADPCPLDPDNDIDSDELCADADSCPNDDENDVDGDLLCAGVDPFPYSAYADYDGDSITDDVDSCPTDRLNLASADVCATCQKVSVPVDNCTVENKCLERGNLSGDPSFSEAESYCQSIAPHVHVASFRTSAQRQSMVSNSAVDFWVGAMSVDGCTFQSFDGVMVGDADLQDGCSACSGAFDELSVRTTQVAQRVGQRCAL